MKASTVAVLASASGALAGYSNETITTTVTECGTASCTVYECECTAESECVTVVTVTTCPLTTEPATTAPEASSAAPVTTFEGAAPVAQFAAGAAAVAGVAMLI